MSDELSVVLAERTDGVISLRASEMVCQGDHGTRDKGKHGLGVFVIDAKASRDVIGEDCVDLAFSWNEIKTGPSERVLC